MLTIETELKSVLTIAKALREGCTVYATLPDKPGNYRVRGVKGCAHLSKREVLTAAGWNHPVRVWIEHGAGSGDMPAAA